MTQAPNFEALAQYRGRAQCQLIAARQLIDARQHNTLYRIRHTIETTFLRGQQQLLQEQRVTLGALDALTHKFVFYIDQGNCQLQ